MPAPKKNQYAVGNMGGRPPVFKSAKVLAKKVDKYFDYIKGEYKKTKVKIKDDHGKTVGLTEEIECIRQPEYASITGLALYLGFASRQSLDDYEKKEVFTYTIARARTRVAFHYEQQLNSSRAFGAMFALKNMDGWFDKTEVVSTNKNLNYNSEPLTAAKVKELDALKEKEY